jgi:hypothetical protein
VYAAERSDYSLRSRFGWLVEDIFRPRIAQLPDFWQNLLVKILAWRHYREYKAVGGYNRDKWRRKDSEHFVRDRWTCLYAHRQSFNEMMRVFSEMGMEYRFIDPKRYYDFMKVPLIGVGIRGIHPTGAAAEWQDMIPHRGLEGIAIGKAVNGHVWHAPRIVLRGGLLLTLAGDRLGREALSDATRTGLKRSLLLELGRVVAARGRLARYGLPAQLAPRLSNGMLELCATTDAAKTSGEEAIDLLGALSSGEVESCGLVVDPQIARQHFLLDQCRYELPTLLAWVKQRPERINHLVAAGLPRPSPTH